MPFWQEANEKLNQNSMLSKRGWNLKAQGNSGDHKLIKLEQDQPEIF